jgi:hypothetical protein
MRENSTTLAPHDKGASDKVLSPHSELQTQLAKHQTFHERVKAINSTLRKARIAPAVPDAYERSREVLTSVLGDERLVEMYLRQLWQVGRGGRHLKFPASVLIKNGQTIRSIQETLTETQTGQSGAHDARRPTAINSNHEGTS